jgi:polyisoprenoid-binding protein YceI
MKKLILSLVALLLVGAVQAFTVAQSWQISNTYSIKFACDASSGIFKTFKGAIAFDEQNLATSSFNIAIDVNSINTGNAMMNKHAKSDEWFDAAKYPEIKFTSKKFVKSAAGYQVTGDLEIHGIKKEVVIPFTFAAKGAAATFAGAFSVNRSDFKIGKPGGEVGEAIKVTVSVPVSKK